MKQSKLAAELGLHPSVVARDKVRGMPTHSVEAARAWRLANVRARVGTPTRTSAAPAPTASPPPEPSAATEYANARARREVAEANLAELRLREQSGKLVEVDQVRAEVARIAIYTRETLMNLALRLAPVVAAETDQVKIEQLFQTEFRHVLTALADGL
jgi:hypothetical protein